MRNGTKIIRHYEGRRPAKTWARARAPHTSGEDARMGGKREPRLPARARCWHSGKFFKQGYQARLRTGAAGDGGLLPSSGSRAARNAYPAWPSSGRDGERAHTPWPSSGRGGAHEYPAWPSSGRDGGREHTPRLSSSRSGAYGTLRDAGWTLPPSHGSGGQRGARETLRDAG